MGGFSGDFTATCSFGTVSSNSSGCSPAGCTSGGVVIVVVGSESSVSNVTQDMQSSESYGMNCSDFSSSYTGFISVTCEAGVIKADATTCTPVVVAGTVTQEVTVVESAVAFALPAMEGVSKDELQAAMDTPATKQAYAKTLQSSLGVENLEDIIILLIQVLESVSGGRRLQSGGAFEVNVEFQLRTMEADANATVGLTDKIEKLGDPTSSEQQAFASSLGPNLQEAAAADPSAAALTQAAQAVEDNGVQVKYTKKPAVSVSVVVVEVNITSNATDFLSPEVEDEIDTMGLAAAVIGGILAAGFCAFLAGLCFAYRVIGYWEKKKQKELLQDESESNHVANMPGGFDYEDEIGEAETSMPRMPPPSTAPSRMSWDDHDDIADSHEPPEVQVEQSPPTPNGRAPEMTTEESDIWNPDEMVEDKISNETSQDTSAGRAQAAEAASSHSDGSMPAPSPVQPGEPVAPAPVIEDEDEDDEEVELEVAAF